jgi:hypothetical protein
VLRQTKCFNVYPNKSVLEDLITRTGPATDDDFSPFDGKADEIDSQFSGSQRANYKPSQFIEYTLKTYKDLDPSKVKEVMQYGILQEVGSESGKYATLEDLIINGVESSKVKEYIVNMCVGWKKNHASPAVENAEIYTRTLRPIDADGEPEEEKLLQVRNDYNLSNSDYEEVIHELPHTIKSIWSYSKMYKANIFSFIFAYMDIVYRKNKRVTITDFRDYPTFLLKSDGTFDREFIHEADNKYTIYPSVTKIFIYSNEHKAEFGLCMKFINALKTLGIDYRDEDPYEYTNEFVNSIVCTYLPNNDQYFSDYRDVDIEIMVAINPENIFSTTKSSLYTSVFTDNNNFDYGQSAYFVSERIKLAYRMGEIDDSFFTERKDDVLRLLDALMSAEYKQPYVAPRNLLTFEADGMLYLNKEVLQLPGKCFGSYRGRKDYWVAFTKYGFAVVLKEEYDEVEYLTYEDCCEKIKEYANYGDIQTSADWKLLGIDN